MRNTYDLSHLSHICGDIGRIQTITVIPVEAGASIELAVDGVGRLAPTRKEIVSDCQVDICAFFVPHRIVYGQDWIDFINGGPDTPITFTGIAVDAAYRAPAYLGLPTCGATINRALVEGYNRIWSNYYAVPAWTGNADGAPIGYDFDWYPTTESGADRCRKYGRLAARLPHVLNGGNIVNGETIPGWESSGLTDADQEVPVAVAGSVGTFRLTDLAQIQSRYKSELSSAWFTHFYQDVMQQKWGTSVSRDADPRNLRPEMLGRSTRMLSGKDVDGTDDATLGTFQGKTLDRVSFSMRRKLFAEHGNVFVLALFRYPLVHTREVHPLLNTVSPTYDEVTGDPDRWSNLAPILWDPKRWTQGYGGYIPGTYNQEPYGQHYRFQNNRVHPNFEIIPGYPFSAFAGTNPTSWYYYQNNEYQNTFQTTQIGQWQLSALIKAAKYSHIPDPKASIFAGAN